MTSVYKAWNGDFVNHHFCVKEYKWLRCVKGLLAWLIKANNLSDLLVDHDDRKW